MISGVELHGRIRYSLRYRCSGCGRPHWSHHAMEVSGLSATSVDSLLRSDPPMPNIPVGWTMNGRTDLRCPSCRRTAVSRS